MTDRDSLPPSSDDVPDGLREVRYECSRELAKLLAELRVTLLVSTYQAGKLVAIGAPRGTIALSFHNFEQAMGVAVHPRRIAVGGRSQIWLLRSAPELAARMEGDRFDACYLARASHVTDEIHTHEMAWSGDELWFVNTRFSCLCTLHENYSFVPRWSPPFISQLAAEDRCHLNGLAMDEGQPRYVTAMAETNTANGWRPIKATDGCVIEVATGRTVARGFAMPHSPRLHAGRLWVLDSGRGAIAVIDPNTGEWQAVSGQPGYTRGLAFYGPYAFVGLSKIRETATFGGVPIAAQRDQLKCAVAMLDLRSGERVAYFEFLTGVDEIFDVQILPGVQFPFLAGPYAAREGQQQVWYAPHPERLPL